MPATATFPPLVYPDAPSSDQLDDLHGVQVPDPYRWLEEQESPATRDWIAAENRLTSSVLDQLPAREGLRRRLTELWNYDKYELVFRRGERIFFTCRSGLQNQAVLHWQEGLDGTPRPLFDPNALAADGTTALTGFDVSDDGRSLAYGLSDAGSDWQTWRVREVATGVDGPDELHWVKFSKAAWAPDGGGFFYARYDAPAPGEAMKAANRHQKLYFHRLGTPQAEDRLVYARPEDPEWAFMPDVMADGAYLVITLWRGTQRETGLIAQPIHPDGQPAGLPIEITLAWDALYRPVGSDGARLLVHTDLDAPNGRVIAIDLADPVRQRWQEVIPQMEDALQSASRVGNQLIGVYLHDACHVARCVGLAGERDRRLDILGGGGDTGTGTVERDVRSREHGDRAGTLGGDALAGGRDASMGTVERDVLMGGRDAMAVGPMREIALPGPGSVLGFFGRPEDEDTFYLFTSFNMPGRLYRYDLASGESTVFRAPKAPFDPEDFVTDQVFFDSRDGTRIPMFLCYKRGMARSGDVPTCLYGYGGFNVALTPGFSPGVLAWLEQGGLYAQANLRGGGEYGKNWHMAGTKDNKQNVFDDFIAAAEWLVASGYTKPAQLGIYGGSNGGLLVGACLTQRPDLFGACVPVVGVLDMLRFHKFTIGWAWVSDYGSPDDPIDFEALLAYSPYHNLKPGTAYPPTLIMTGDHDDRVFPAHSYKFAAALQHAQGGDAPVLLRVTERAGHGMGKPTGKQIEEATDLWSFLGEALGEVR